MLAAAVAVLIAATASAELAKWDQAGVTQLAEKLGESTERLYDAYYAQPPSGIAGSGSADGFSFRDRVRLMHSEARHLAAELRKGKGHDATRNVYFRIKELNDVAAMYGRRMLVENPATGEFAKVEDLINQLAPYYDPHWKRDTK